MRDVNPVVIRWLADMKAQRDMEDGDTVEVMIEQIGGGDDDKDARTTQKGDVFQPFTTTEEEDTDLLNELADVKMKIEWDMDCLMSGREKTCTNSAEPCIAIATEQLIMWASRCAPGRTTSTKDPRDRVQRLDDAAPGRGRQALWDYLC